MAEIIINQLPYYLSNGIIKDFKEDLEAKDRHQRQMIEVCNNIQQEYLRQKFLNPLFELYCDPYHEYESDWDSDGHHYSGRRTFQRDLKRFWREHSNEIHELYPTLLYVSDTIMLKYNLTQLPTHLNQNVEFPHIYQFDEEDFKGRNLAIILYASYKHFESSC